MHHLPLKRDEVTLWIGGPSTPTVPDSVPGFVMAIGPSLIQPPGRGRIAILEVIDLLRMLQVQARPHVALLRAVTVKWPIEALVPADDRVFEEKLGRGVSDRHASIEWLVDLAGLGGMIEAGSLVQASGTLPGIVRAALSSRLRAIAQSTEGGEWLTKELVIDEHLVLAGLSNVTPANLAAFWAVLWLGEFGSWISRLELESYLSMEFEEAMPPVLERVQSGLDNLAESHIISVQDTSYRMERWDYIEPLLGHANRRLRRSLHTVSQVAFRATEDFLRKLGSIEQELTLHEIRAMQRYEAKMIRDGRDPQVYVEKDRTPVVASENTLVQRDFDALDILRSVKDEMKRLDSGVT